MSRSGERRPLTRSRSEWTETPAPPLTPSLVPPRAWRRNVHDGVLTAFLTKDPAAGGLCEAWHLSISHRPNGPRQAQRYPTWDEIADARDQLTDPDVEFIMVLPRSGEYVAIHDTTFHLHERNVVTDPTATDLMDRQ